VVSLLSFSVFANYCVEKKPTENFFSIDYINEYIFAPNWDDICYEGPEEEIKPCYAEAEKWESWAICKKATKIERTLKCSVEGVDVFSTDIESVKINILNNGLAVDYKYTNIDATFFDLADNSNPSKVYEITDDKITFGLDGETFGKLASFDNGNTFEGRAVISQDFPVFLTCK
jgi:hypothetical protein